MSTKAGELHNLAHAYQSAGDVTRAIPLYEATLSDSERVLGADHPLTMQVGKNLDVAQRGRRGR